MKQPPYAKRNRPAGHSRQGGYTLIELIMVIGLMAAATMLTFSEKTLELEQQQAKKTGYVLNRYNEAVRSWLTEHQNAPSTVYVGSAWLKDTSCGGLNTKAYLPCSFDAATSAAPIRFGQLALQTQITTTTVDGKPVTSALTETSTFTVRGKKRADLAGLAAITTAAGQISGANNPLLASGNGSTQSDPTDAVITMTANRRSTDGPWLRTDGSNTMDASLQFGPLKDEQFREIVGVSRLQNLAGEILSLGQTGGAELSDQIMVDANQQLLGALTVSNAANLQSAIEVTQGNIVTLNGDINGEEVRATDALYAPEFRDAVPGFVVNPSGHSEVNELVTPRDLFDPTRGKFEASIYLDPDDNYFSMNPAGNTRFLDLTLEQARVSGRSRDGDPCGWTDPATGIHHPAHGMMGITSNGTLLTCMRAGYMVNATGKPTYVKSAWVTNGNPTTAVCPAPRAVTGGICHVRNGSAASELEGAINGNGWACRSLKLDAEVQAQAFCR